MNGDPVRKYYQERMRNEKERPAEPADGAVEFEVNRRTIERHLPAGARVLDIGDGSGLYAAWLAGRGHDVTLAESSRETLGAARRKLADAGVEGNVEIVEADARDLSRWPEASFDAVLCLGPFYHLPEEERARATAEIARVLRPGSIAFIALLSRYSVLRRALTRREEEHRNIASPKFVAKMLGEEDTTHTQPSSPPDAGGVQPDEVAPFFERFGFDSLGLVASEGIAAGIESDLARLAEEDPAAYERAMKIVMETSADASILGMSGHLLYVGRREGATGDAAATGSTAMAPAESMAMAPAFASVASAPVAAMMMPEKPESERYGAIELKRSYNRNLLMALGISVALHGMVIGYYAFGDRDEAIQRKIVLDDLPAPRDTTWSVPITLSKPQGGGGSPEEDKPLGLASKGAPQATPDRTHNNVDKTRSVIIKNPDKIRLVDKEPAPQKVAGDMRDSSKQTNVKGTNGQNPNGTGKKPAGGGGGTGIGVGVGAATGLGSRGWDVRPRATYPGGLNVPGKVVLRFTVLPNGDIVNIIPVKRDHQALVDAAIAGLRRARAQRLPENVPQISQTATIPFTFELK